MEFGRREVGMRFGVEGIYVYNIVNSCPSMACETCSVLTLCDDPPNDTQPSQISTSRMSLIRPRLVQTRPSQETPRPVSLPRLMILAKLIVVNRPIRLILRIRPVRAAIIRKARGDTDPRARQQQSLAILDWTRASQVRSRVRQ